MDIGVDTAMRLGFRVILRPEPVSTPQSYFTTLVVSQEHPRTMGLTITASHNPAPYIGVKFTVPTVAAIGQDCGQMGGLTKVREIYHSARSLSPSPAERWNCSISPSDTSTSRSNRPEWRPGILRGWVSCSIPFTARPGRRFTGPLPSPGAESGARLIPDGNFPTGSPNPTSQGKMKTAIALAAEKNCRASGSRRWGSNCLRLSRGILTAGFAFVPILKACVGRARAKNISAL